MVLKATNSSGVKAGRGLGTFALGICALVRFSPVMFGYTLDRVELKIHHKSKIRSRIRKLKIVDEQEK